MFKDFKSLLSLNWPYIFLIIFIFWIGEINLFSASGGSIDPWAKKQFFRFLSFLPLFFIIIFIKPRVIFNFSGLLMIFIIIGLIVTLSFGLTGMGARRWIKIGFFNLQVSEFAKIFLVLYLAKYFHNLDSKGHLEFSRSILPVLVTLIIFF